jgi:hypothetical protein
MTLKEWESIPPEEQYRRLLNSRSADLQKTHEGFSFLGELKKEDYEVAEVTHARFTLSRDQLKAQIQAIENLFKERRGFHVHISFPEEHIEQVAPFFVWHQMANLWILLMNAKAGLVGDAPTGLPNKDLLKDAVENPPLESLCCAKFGGLGFRHNFLSGGKNYQVYQSPRAGLELRDAGSGTEEILAMVDWVRGSVLNQSWKRWQLDRNQTRQVLMHHHPQNEDSVILGTGTQTEALFLREYSANSVFMWPLATLEDWDFPFRDGPEIRWRKLNPKERQKVIQAREIYKDELQKTRKSLTDFLARNPDTPEYEERTLVHLAIMGDFALWAKHSGLDEIYGAALRPE